MLRRPLIFIILVLLILLMIPSTLMRTPTNIFPEIDIPVTSIIRNYNGLPAKRMADRITSVTERSLTTTVNDIEHIESQSLGGMSIIKVLLQPNANIQTALAQIVMSTQTQVWQSPSGTTSPPVAKYSASNILILRLGLSSNTLLEQKLNDTALNFLHPCLITVSGTAVPFPHGGKGRQIAADLDMQKLLAQNLTPVDIVNVVGVQNLILPTGTQKIDATEYGVTFNGTPGSTAMLNMIPVRISSSATPYLGDVANVRNGLSPQTSMVRQDG